MQWLLALSYTHWRLMAGWKIETSPATNIHRDFGADLGQAAHGVGWYDSLTVALFDGKRQTDM